MLDASGKTTPYWRRLNTDFERARRIAYQLPAGRVASNAMTDDSLAPWGGFNHSGFGREYGRYGIEAFVEAHVIFEA